MRSISNGGYVLWNTGSVTSASSALCASGSRRAFWSKGNGNAATWESRRARSYQPQLVNIYLHDVFDLWVRPWQKRETKGKVVWSQQCFAVKHPR